MTNARKAELRKQWGLANPEKKKLSDRKQSLKKRYNITLEQYNELFIKQNGLCAGCDLHASQLRRNLCVDHDHFTGKIRGLLCDDCNIILGHAKDDMKTLHQLTSYLENSQSDLAGYNTKVVEVKFPKKVG
jgi:hypothetical protein